MVFLFLFFVNISEVCFVGTVWVFLFDKMVNVGVFVGIVYLFSVVAHLVFFFWRGGVFNWEGVCSSF